MSLAMMVAAREYGAVREAWRVVDEYFTYVQTYIAVRHALEDDDAADLARIALLVEQHRLATIRHAGSLAISDARAGLPVRSEEHLSRLLGAPKDDL